MAPLIEYLHTLASAILVGEGCPLVYGLPKDSNSQGGSHMTRTETTWPRFSF